MTYLLQPNMDKIKEARDKFIHVYFEHVFKELTKKENKLSKGTLLH